MYILLLTWVREVASQIPEVLMRKASKLAKPKDQSCINKRISARSKIGLRVSLKGAQSPPLLFSDITGDEHPSRATMARLLVAKLPEVKHAPAGNKSDSPIRDRPLCPRFAQ